MIAIYMEAEVFHYYYYYHTEDNLNTHSQATKDIAVLALSLYVVDGCFACLL